MAHTTIRRYDKRDRVGRTKWSGLSLSQFAPEPERALCGLALPDELYSMGLLRRHYHLPMHERMQAAKIVGLTRLRRGVAERVVRIHRMRPHTQRPTNDAVRDVVAVPQVTVVPALIRNVGGTNAKLPIVTFVPSSARLASMPTAATTAPAPAPRHGATPPAGPTTGPVAKPPTCSLLQTAANGGSTITRGACDDTRLTRAMPRWFLSSSAGTTMGPGLGAVPGAGWGNAVERAA